MADSVGTQLPATYFHEVRRMVQPANREKPERQEPHQRDDDETVAAEPAAQHAAAPAPKRVYRLPNLQSHVMVQELAQSPLTLAKEPLRRRRRTPRERRYARPEDIDLRLLPLAATIRVVV